MMLTLAVALELTVLMMENYPRVRFFVVMTTAGALLVESLLL